MFTEYLRHTWNCDKWGWVGMKVRSSKKVYYTGMVLMKWVLMGTQTLLNITNAMKEKFSMQEKCKTYPAWEGFPKVTIYLKDETESGEQRGEDSILCRHINKDPTTGMC